VLRGWRAVFSSPLFYAHPPPESLATRKLPLSKQFSGGLLNS
jgi:hypothetical protein